MQIVQESLSAFRAPGSDTHGSPASLVPKGSEAVITLDIQQLLGRKNLLEEIQPGELPFPLLPSLF
jgi:hypothetical protein